MHYMGSGVLFRLIVLTFCNHSFGCNSGVIEDIVRRLESVERSNEILRQNDIKLKRIIRQQQRDINILQSTLNHKTEKVTNQNLEDDQRKEEDNLVSDNSRKSNEEVDRIREGEIAIASFSQDENVEIKLHQNDSPMKRHRQNKMSMIKLFQGEMAVDNTSQNNIAMDNHTRQDKVAVDNLLDVMALDNHHQEQPRATQVNSDTVALHAVIWVGEVPHLSRNQIIVFDHVMLNLGNGYHENGGIFITPKSGLYLFSVSILSHRGLAVELMKNGQLVAKVYTNNGGDQGSNTAVMDLKVGDEVFVKVDQHSGTGETSLYGDYYTSITGVLLKEL